MKRFEKITGYVSLHPRTDRYNGRGRPRKTDFGSQLFFMTKNGVYSANFIDEQNLSVEQMKKRLNKNLILSDGKDD